MIFHKFYTTVVPKNWYIKLCYMYRLNRFILIKNLKVFASFYGTPCLLHWRVIVMKLASFVARFLIQSRIILRDFTFIDCYKCINKKMQVNKI